MERKITKIQITTVVAFIMYAVLEFKTYQWAQTLPPSDPVIRVDLIVIYPVLLTLLIVSIWQYVKNKHK